jgi:hypothetical protein
VHPSQLKGIALLNSDWAMQVLGYTKARRSAFWQFVYGNGVPHVRTGRRKIQFSPDAVMSWIARRNSISAPAQNRSECS